jgi:hypothetical protein
MFPAITFQLSAAASCRNGGRAKKMGWKKSAHSAH